MLRSILSVLTAASIALGTTGCATLLSGGESRLSVEIDGPSEPTTIVTGVIDDQRVVRKEPRFTVPLDRGTPYALAMSADGYEPDMVIVKTEPAPAYWLNFAPLVLGTAFMLTAPSREQGSMVFALGQLAFLGGALIDMFTKNASQHNTQEVKLRLRRAEAAD